MDSVPVKSVAVHSLNGSAERRYAAFLEQLSVKDRAVMVKSDESREGGTEAQTNTATADWSRLQQLQAATDIATLQGLARTTHRVLQAREALAHGEA